MESLATYVVLSTIVTNIVFLTFYPALLALIFEVRDLQKTSAESGSFRRMSEEGLLEGTLYP